MAELSTTTLQEPQVTAKRLTRVEIYKARKRMLRQQFFWSWTKMVVVTLVLTALCINFGFHFSRVAGSSMQPTLQDGEWIVVNRLVYLLGTPARGEVVVLKDPVNQQGGEYLVKRVVGLPEDIIEVRAGVLLRNGRAVQEDYTEFAIEDGDFPPYMVGAGEYFVMGDNRAMFASLDSRTFGTVDEDRIVGRVGWIIYPFQAMGRTNLR
jgi:signal peptidase I